MARRGENIYKRKDGRWEARYPKSYSSEGHIVYGYVYGQTYNEAKSKRTQRLTDLHSCAGPVSEKPKYKKVLRDLAEEWLRYKRASVKEATYVRYRHLYERHIDAEFGDTELRILKSAKVGDYIRAKQKTTISDGLAAKTVQDILSVYHLIIQYGMEKGYLSVFTENIASKQNKSKSIDKEVTIFSSNERIQLENYILRLKTARSFGIVLSMYTGIRIGELCALRWSDVDLKNGFLYIRHTIQRLHDYSDTSENKTRIVISSPKTAASARIIPLSSFLVKQLQGYASLPDHFVLTGSTKPEEPRTYLYFYKKQLEHCGISQYTFHTIRHTFATRCIEQGVDVKSLSEILGHSNVKITMNRYVHPSLESKRKQLDKLYTNL